MNDHTYSEALAVVAAEGVWQVTRIGGAAPNCCILATRLLIDTLESYGIVAKPEPTRALVGNQAGIDRLQAGDSDTSSWPSDAWTVGVDSRIPTAELTSSRPGGYAAHLVAVVQNPERQLLVDASAQQFHRPEHDLKVLGPLAGPLPEEWATGYPLVAPFPNGSAVYWHDPQAPGWQHSRDWRRDARGRSFVRYVRQYVDARPEVIEMHAAAIREIGDRDTTEEFLELTAEGS